jgi:hypothetical protein
MTENEIMALANQSSGQDWMDEAHIQRFAALVAAAERNACVKSCKEQRLLLGEDEAKYANLGIAMCVDAIKTRGIK